MFNAETEMETEKDLRLNNYNNEREIYNYVSLYKKKSFKYLKRYRSLTYEHFSIISLSHENFDIHLRIMLYYHEYISHMYHK